MIKMKFIIILTGLLLSICPAAFASSLILSSNNADPGDSAVLISLSLDNNDIYYGADMELNFDYSVLSLNRIEVAPRLSGLSEVGYYEYMPGKVSLAFFDLIGTTLAADSGDIFDIYFDISPMVEQTTTEISITDMSAVTESMQFDAVDIIPGTIGIPSFMCGDANSDMAVNIFDITFIISFLYLEGPPPDVLASANVNGDATVNIFDITYLIGFLYIEGPALDCAPVEKSPSDIAVTKIDENQECASINCTVKENETVIGIESPENIYGLEMVLESVNGLKLNLTSLSEDVQLYYSQSDNLIKLGMVDITGKHFIVKGKQDLIAANGDVEIISIIAADKKSKSIPFKSSSVIIPREYSLDQNYPNPFNPSTEIKFALPQVSNVNLEIFNILGRRVTTLINDRLDAGYHSVTWDGIDSKGQDVATGVYLYRIKAGNFIKSRKMLLLK